jgi:hypothetical protein
MDMHALTWTAAMTATRKRIEMRRLRHVLKLFAADTIVHNFSHMDAAFLTDQLPQTDETAPRPMGGPIVPTPDMFNWIRARCVTALAILKDGVSRENEVMFQQIAESLAAHG